MISISKSLSPQEETNVYLYLSFFEFMDKIPKDPPLFHTAAGIHINLAQKRFPD